VIVGVAKVALQQVVVHVLRGELRAHAVEPEPRELEHHHGPGGVLGERLVNAQRDLPARRHLAAEQMRLDQLVRDAAAHAQRRRYTATGSPHSRG
jgi:hypothetical protein